jgi:porin
MSILLGTGAWAITPLVAITLAMGAPSDPQETQPSDRDLPPAEAGAAPQGLLPIPNYTGDLWTRAFLTGDWGGTPGRRTDWANKGIQLEVNWSQYVQGVVDGGRDETTRYGGHLNYLLNLDLMRMGVLPGAMVKVRAESRYGASVNGAAGSILPVNLDAFFPITRPVDEDIAITVTDLTYYQFLSEQFGVFVGKFDTLNGDPNEFASGRGASQFMNFNFVFNPVLALRLPYSTLGGGVVWMPTKEITVSSMVFNTLDSSTSSGFGDIGDGGSWVTEASFQYRLSPRGLPGGQNVGFLYSFDQDFFQFGGDFIFQPGQGLVIPTENETWAVYWSAWQYLFTDQPSEGPMNLLDGQADLTGIGLYARAGFADKNTNPVEWSVSGGVGGRGVFGHRVNDTYGLGYYYSSIQTTRISGILNLEDHTQGFEAFYNMALTPAAHLTFDFQAVDSPAGNLDTAIILGARLGLTF